MTEGYPRGRIAESSDFKTVAVAYGGGGSGNIPIEPILAIFYGDRRLAIDAIEPVVAVPPCPALFEYISRIAFGGNRQPKPSAFSSGALGSVPLLDEYRL
jgi:hypothetical protein